jgi:hypothetical protein
MEELENFLRKNRLSWINLTGGELFLREDLQGLFECMALTQPDLAYTSFPTTGYLVEETLRGVEGALEAGLKRLFVTVSFEGGKDSHDRLRSPGDAFFRAKETFEGLKKMARKWRRRLGVAPGLTLSAELLSCAENPVKDLVRDLALAGPREIHMNLAHRSEHYYGNLHMAPLPTGAAVEQVDQLLHARRFGFTGLDLAERLYLKGARTYLQKGRSPIACQACSSSVFIDGDWSVYPCTVYSRLLGNLKSEGFELKRLASIPAFKETRAAVSAGQCPGCWTPCEAYTAILGTLLKPPLLRLALGL